MSHFIRGKSRPVPALLYCGAWIWQSIIPGIRNCVVVRVVRQPLELAVASFSIASHAGSTLSIRPSDGNYFVAFKRH